MKPKSKTCIPESLVLATLMMLGLTANAIAQSTLEGNWQTGEDNSVVTVETAYGVITGKLISSDNPKAKMGTEILRNFKQIKGVWTGQVYAAKKDKLYDATISPDANVLNIKVSAGIASKKLTWKRAQKPVEK